MKRQAGIEVEFDSVDRALLLELQKDARQTNKALAAKVGVAPSTCIERVRELQARGVVTGFRAEIDPAAIGRPMEAILSIQQRGEQREATEKLFADLARLPETVRAMAMRLVGVASSTRFSKAKSHKVGSCSSAAERKCSPGTNMIT